MTKLAKRITVPFLIAIACARGAADTYVIDDFEGFATPRRTAALGVDTWSVTYDSGKTSVGIIAEESGELPGGPSRVLVISSANSSYNISRKVPFDRISRYPYLRWRWKVTRVPEGADICDPSRDDGAAQVYVSFDLKGSLLSVYPTLLSICYYYGTTEARGETCLWEGYGTFVKFISIRSAREDGVSSWLAEERNVLEDYRKAILDFSNSPDVGLRTKFRQRLERALGASIAMDGGRVPELAVHSFALWVDSNDTRSRAESMYDDIVFSSEPAAAPIAPGAR